MKLHITEKELIKYQFKLVSDIQAEKISEHLKNCADCRERAKQIKRKFSTLELLREETKISDELIKETLKQVERRAHPRMISFNKVAWLNAVAAVLIIGFMLLISDSRWDKKQEREIAKSDKKIRSITSRARTETESVTPLEYTTADKVSEKAISEKPPFAPASAIELVILPRRENVQITIYNSADLTLVRERRNLTLKKGWNWLQFMWANTLIDPTSLALEPLEQANKIDIQQLVFPSRLKDIGRWLIRSEISGKISFEVTYLTSGLNWRAFYMGTLAKDEKTMQLKGYVRVGNNSGEDYENAQTRLIVGEVHILDRIAELAHRQYPHGRPGALEEDEKLLSDTESPAGILYANELTSPKYWRETISSPKEIRKEGLSEYFLYTIEGRETIPQSWSKRLISFTADNIDVKSLYKYDEQRWGHQTIRFISFVNDKKHNLGDTPIPNGAVRIYSLTEEEGLLSYVGRTNTKYIPVDEEVELNMNWAREVIVEPIMTSFGTENLIFDSNNNITGWDEVRTWKIEITNARELPVEVEITRGFETAYWTLDINGEDISYAKHDATHARFKTKVEPRSKRNFKYTIRTYHGRREEFEKNKKRENKFKETKK